MTTRRPPPRSIATRTSPSNPRLVHHPTRPCLYACLHTSFAPVDLGQWCLIFYLVAQSWGSCRRWLCLCYPPVCEGGNG